MNEVNVTMSFGPWKKENYKDDWVCKKIDMIFKKMVSDTRECLQQIKGRDGLV